MKLQEVRQKRNLSQSQLADLAGVSKQVLQRYEIGYRSIDGADLEKLCDIAIALNCKIYDILESDVLIEKLKKTI